jgi:C-terminal peptidase prc
VPPIKLTQAALINSAQGNSTVQSTPTPEGYDALEPTALVAQACQVVRDNVVRVRFDEPRWDQVCADYALRAESVETDAEIDALLADLIHELNDDHSRYVSKQRFEAEFGVSVVDAAEDAGIGAGISVSPVKEDEYLFVWSTCEESSAAKAGIERGDVILEINGEPVTRGDDGFDRTEIYEKLSAKDDSVELLIQSNPDEEPRTVTLEFAPYQNCGIYPVALVSTEPYVGYIYHGSFSSGSEVFLRQLIDLLEEERPLDGLILDIRHNGGGNSDREIAMFTSGEFGTTLMGNSRINWRIRGPVTWSETTPLIILTDGGSASASDYFATALQQAERATFVGMPTAGNTEGISSFNLANETVIRLAVQALELPDGSSLEGVGVIPDIQVPLGQWGLAQTPDIQLDAAIEAMFELIAQQEE